MRTPIVLDTQLMVLLTVGATSTGIIAKHKNLTEFTADDFDLLVHLLGSDPELIMIPNIVSEASNLLRFHRDPERRAIMNTFSELIVRNQEFYVASSKIVKRAEYNRLGVTDTAIIELCTSHFEILTADLDLYVSAVS